MSTENKPDKPEGESCHSPEEHGHKHEHGHEHEHGHKHEHGHEHEHLVNITIDTKLHKIRPGEHTVAQLKDLGKVPRAFDLEQWKTGSATGRRPC